MSLAGRRQWVRLMLEQLLFSNKSRWSFHAEARKQARQRWRGSYSSDEVSFPKWERNISIIRKHVHVLGWRHGSPGGWCHDGCRLWLDNNSLFPCKLVYSPMSQCKKLARLKVTQTSKTINIQISKQIFPGISLHQWPQWSDSHFQFDINYIKNGAGNWNLQIFNLGWKLDGMN